MSHKKWPEAAGLIGLFLIAALMLYIGWRRFWFLTDDAFIAFRYISNAHLGHGYVWNAPPFLPVEGYTSFLWVAMLDIVWRITGILPPVSANWLSLFFSYLALLLGTLMVLRLKLHDGFKSLKLIFVFAYIVFLTLNRTVLAWSSSGLETALMNFLLIGWVYALLFVSTVVRRTLLASLAATALCLCRPDGLLFSAVTVLIVLFSAFRGDGRERRGRILLVGLLPFGPALLHLMWRVSFYGQWLPNTYYAKVTGAWPQSGLLYLASFMLEYGLWLPIGLIVAALVQVARRRDLNRAGLGAIVVGTLLVHMAYYTLIVGGDHFEYRVYSHLLPLVFIAMIWSLKTLFTRRRHVMVLLWASVLISMPVQWTHYALTRDLNTREQTHMMRAPIAQAWPAGLSWYGDVFDRTQAWLIQRHVCMRHQEHKVFWQTQTAQFITREQGEQMPRADYPVALFWSVGVPSWTMPHVNIIDGFGLNDHVIARTPSTRTTVRKMAHSRRPPQGYVESYRPNIEIAKGRMSIGRRAQPLTAEYIAANERRWRIAIESR
jgi:arabinofuranosyltransferase